MNVVEGLRGRSYVMKFYLILISFYGKVYWKKNWWIKLKVKVVIGEEC